MAGRSLGRRTDPGAEHCPAVQATCRTVPLQGRSPWERRRLSHTLTAGDRSRSPDPGLSWVLVAAVSPRPDPGEQVDRRGSRKEEKEPVRTGGTGSPPESMALWRDRAAAGTNEWGPAPAAARPRARTARPRRLFGLGGTKRPAPALDRGLGPKGSSGYRAHAQSPGRNTQDARARSVLADKGVRGKRQSLSPGNSGTATAMPGQQWPEGATARHHATRPK